MVLKDINGNSKRHDFVYTLKKGKRKVQGVPQSQTAALPRPQEEEETDKSKQAQTEQTYEKHWLKLYEEAVIGSEARTAVVQKPVLRVQGLFLLTVQVYSLNLKIC